MKRLALTGMLLVHLSCNYVPCSSSSDLEDVKKLPDPSLMAGTYKPDEFTRNDFKEYATSDSIFLVIETDGNISLHNFPESTFDNVKKAKITTVNGSGTWATSFKSGTTYITTDISFKDRHVPKPSDFRLFKKESKYYILIDFGDPDNCTSVRLKQQ